MSAFAGERLYDDIVRYDAFGVHRTGTVADLATTDWLAGHLQAHGFQVAKRAFPASMFDGTAKVTVAGKTIELFPQEPYVWPDLIIQTRVRSLSSPEFERGDVALVELPFARDATINADAYWPKLTEAAARGAVAAIAVTGGPTGDLIIFNTPKDGSALPLPVLLVAPNRAVALRAGARAGAPVHLSIQGQRRTLTASNLLGRREGLGRSIVVSTPQSGWTHAAGERGPGVALWRATVEWAARSQNIPWVFLATSGHELAHAGLDSMLKDPLLPTPDEVRLWIHLGANIAVYDYARRSSDFRLLSRPNPDRKLVASPAVWPAAADTFGRMAGLWPLPAAEAATAGEAKRILAAGYAPVLGFFGPGALHHVPIDRASIATGPDILGPIGLAMERFLGRVLGPTDGGR